MVIVIRVVYRPSFTGNDTVEGAEIDFQIVSTSDMSLSTLQG